MLNFSNKIMNLKTIFKRLILLDLSLMILIIVTFFFESAEVADFNRYFENDFSKLAEITCKNWMENVEGATNKANILFLALSYLVKHNDDLNQRYLGEFFDLMSDDSISRKIVLEIIKIFDIAPSSIYSDYFKNRDKLRSFKIFKGIDSQLENKIGLELASSAAETWQYAEKRLRRLEYNG